MRLSLLQVTRSTVTACAILPKTEGARSWSRDGHTRAALWWKTQLGAQVFCRIALHTGSLHPQSTRGTLRICLSVWWNVWKWPSCFQVAHALSQGCGLWWCFSSCLTGQHSCELRLSFHLWLSFHLSPDSGDQQGLPSSSHRLLVQNRTVGTQTLGLPCCSCAIVAKSCTCILLQLGHWCWILNKTDSDRLQLRCKQMAEGFELS